MSTPHTARFLSAYAGDDPDVTSGWMAKHTRRSLGEGGYASADFAEEFEDNAGVLRQAQDGSKDGERSRTINPRSFIFSLEFKKHEAIKN
ncbi:MAG: hypothetical protein Q8O30_06765 [Candidatus Omnitrophota bacterium]|nr:hypothetical protein [Candidatus Omnitrophota bacterium]